MTPRFLQSEPGADPIVVESSIAAPPDAVFDAPASRVEVVFAPEGEGTRVRVVHSGIPEGPARTGFAGGGSAGWASSSTGRPRERASRRPARGSVSSRGGIAMTRVELLRSSETLDGESVHHLDGVLAGLAASPALAEVYPWFGPDEAAVGATS